MRLFHSYDDEDRIGDVGLQLFLFAPPTSMRGVIFPDCTTKGGIPLGSAMNLEIHWEYDLGILTLAVVVTGLVGDTWI